ncbi:hypothetical protein POM88_024602 [Heracleum sosnowskyi]|uniref:DC1 domain-containing protein n=1 Tax=Heracleum sosnowskyi TaxID=360622 RepID=A0AAD8I371_9APIA|nr:hypothetical protein POM88_024602 [Heracleum sosnowskyi]
MEGVLKHFTHDHPLILFKYNNSPADVLCYGCGDPIITNTYVYRCSNTTPRSNASQEDSSCTNYFLHKTCSTLPPNIQHDLDIQHMQTLRHDEYRRICDFCEKRIWKQFFYKCTACYFDICLKCSSLQRDLNHASHNHTLTLLPLKSSHFCRACGTDEGGKDFSYLCKTCLFWIHNRCASAPPKLIFKSHAIDHPLVLDYSIPEEYRRFGVLCNLCCEVVDSSLWLYYCAFCRYFAHIKCVLSATENINEDVGDVDDPDLVHFPVSEDNPSLLYQLIQKFAENFSNSIDERSGGKADKIRHCGNGHSLVLFDELNNKNVAETESSESMICDGCVLDN